MKLSFSIITVLCALWLTPASADESSIGSDLEGLLDYAREQLKLRINAPNLPERCR